MLQIKILVFVKQQRQRVTTAAMIAANKKGQSLASTKKPETKVTGTKTPETKVTGTKDA